MKKLKKRISAILLSSVMVFSLMSTSEAKVGEGATKENGWTTTDTLTSVTELSEEGVYSAEWLLKNENVFAWGDSENEAAISFSHMVGLAMANGRVAVSGGCNNYLTAGYNYFHAKNNGIGDMTTVLYEDTSRTRNPFYVGETNKIEQVGTDFRFEGKMVPTKTPIYKNDKFVDFTKAKETLVKQSKGIYEAANQNSATVKITMDNYQDYVKFAAGYSGIVIDIGTTVIVDDAVIDAMQNNSSGVPNAFILNGNFESEKATVINITKQESFTMPATYVFDDNKIMRESSMLQAHYKYNEDLAATYRSWFNKKGTNVVWNVVNAPEIKFTQSAGTDMMGHMFAPNAKITGGCGSVNGGFICESVNLPQTEAHMYTLSANITPSDLIDPPIEALIKAKKELKKDGSKQILSGDEFTFQLDSNSENAKIVHQEKKNGSEGNIEFDKLIFNQEGEYYYTLKEVKGIDPKITYDDTIYQVRVTISKADPKVKVEYSKDGSVWEENVPVFLNTEETQTVTLTPVKAEIKAKKKLHQHSNTGKLENLKGDDFKFELKDSNGTVLKTISNDANGDIAFGELTYDKPGIYKYTIREIAEGDSNLEYDSKEYKVEVRVTKKNGTNELEANVIYANNVNKKLPPVFTNVHKYNKTNIDIVANKKLYKGHSTETEALSGNEFSFVLTPYVSNPGNEQYVILKNDANGTVKCSKEYYEIGTYKYTLVESTSNKKPGIAYDGTKYLVTVDVQAGENHNLVSTISYKEYGSAKNLPDGEVPVFENRKQDQTETSTNAVIQAKKIFKDNYNHVLNLEADQYEFELTGKNGISLDAQYATAKNQEDGSIEFEIPYTTEGTYTYELREKNGTEVDVSYDTNSYDIIVEVKKIENNLLVSTVTYRNLKPGMSIPVFTNVKSVTPPKEAKIEIKANKTLKSTENVNKTLSNNQFTFKLKEDGVATGITKCNNANGEILFPLSYNEEGQHTYTLSEEKGTNPLITYDQTKYIVKVDVTKDVVQNKLNASVEYFNENNQKISASDIKFENTIKEGKISKKVEITWEGDTPESRPENVSVQLKRDGENEGEAKVISPNSDKWETEWKDLPKYNPTTGEEYKYTVVQVPIPDTYNEESNIDNGTKIVIHNKKKSDHITTVRVKKNLYKNDINGDAVSLKNEEFAFELKDENGIVYTAKNDIQGDVVFQVAHAVAGTYIYTLKEIKGVDANTIYDDKEYTVTIQVNKIGLQLQSNFEIKDANGTKVENNQVVFNNIRRDQSEATTEDTTTSTTETTTEDTTTSTTETTTEDTTTSTTETTTESLTPTTETTTEVLTPATTEATTESLTPMTTEETTQNKKPNQDDDSDKLNAKDEEDDADKLNAKDEEETKTDHSAKTGDQMNAFIWIVLLLSVMFEGILIYLKKRRVDE